MASNSILSEENQPTVIAVCFILSLLSLGLGAWDFFQLRSVTSGLAVVNNQNVSGITQQLTAATNRITELESKIAAMDAKMAAPPAAPVDPAAAPPEPAKAGKKAP